MAVAVGTIGWVVAQTGLYAQTLHERFEDDPIVNGRFVQQVAGTESSFTYDPSGQRLRASLDIDFDAASYTSREFAPITDRQSVSFSVRFQVTEADESDGLTPSAVIGLVTSRHVDNFGDGLTLALTVRGGKLFAGPNIDTAGLPKRAATNIVLELGKEYLAYARYAPETRSLRLDIFGGSNFITHIGAAITDPFPTDRTLSVDRIGLQNAGARQFDSARGSLTILVDDLFTPGAAPVNIFIDDIVVPETSGSAIFPITLPLPPENAISVEYRAESGTALEGADFEPTAGTLIIPPGSTRASITVPIRLDGIAETNESFTVRLSNPRGANIERGTATAEIQDSDRVTISAVPASVLEGNAADTVARVVFRLSNPSASRILLPYRTSDGSALAGADYVSTNGIVVIEPASTEAFAPVIVKADRLAEGNEFFYLELAPPANAQISTNRVSVEIRDDDPLPLITVANAIFTEGDFGPQDRSFTAVLSGPSARPITLRYSTVDGTALAGQDYTAISQVVTIQPGQLSAPLPVKVLGDVQPEPDEYFEIVLSEAGNAVLANTRAQATITDDDRDPQINIENAQVQEGNAGETLMRFRVTLSKVPRDPVSVDYLTIARPAAASSATAGVDFRSASGRLTFQTGETNQFIEVPIVGDLSAEETEFFDVQLSAPLNADLGTSKAQGTILDDDAVTLAVTGPAPVLEGDGFDGQAVFTVKLSGVPTRTVTVGFATRDGTAQAPADYAPTNGTLTFLLGENTKTVSVPVKGDLSDEPDEFFEIVLSGPSGADLSVARAAAVIKDNDVPEVRIDDLPSIPEGGTNATIARFLVRLSSPPEEEAQIEFGTMDDTAMAGADYVARTGRLIFPPGISELPLDITILPDSIDELDETFFVQLRNPLKARITRGQAVGTIKDDDPAPTITIGDVVVGECMDGSSLAVATLHLSAPAEHPVRVQFQTQEDTAKAGQDFVATNGVVEFPPGATEQSIAVQLICDNSDEAAEGFGIGLSGPDGGVLGDGGGGGRVTIVDNDPPEITVDDTSVREGNTGLTNAIFTVNLSSPLDQELAFNYFTEAGSATPGVDYAHVSGTFIFPPGVTLSNIVVPVINDTIPEGNESFRLILTNAVNARIVRGAALGTIRDDDVPELRFDDATVVEGDHGSAEVLIPLTLSKPLLQPVSVDYRTRAGTALAGVDYIETNGRVSFPAGEVRREIAVSVIGDVLIESPETFAISFFNEVNATLARDEMTVTVADNDGVPVLTVDDLELVEGDLRQQRATFVLKLSRPSQQTVTVRVATANGTATAPGDYAALAPQDVQFAPNVTTRNVSVTINGDLTYEGDEDFYLVLSNVSNAVLARTQARLVIHDDDSPPKLSVNDATVTEGLSGVTNAIFTVSLSAAASGPVTFDFTTVNGSARSGSDFLATGGVLTLPPGVTKTNISVPVLGDGEAELDESFTLVLSDPVGAELDRAQGTGTIINDDGIALSVEDSSVLEPDSGEAALRFVFKLAKAVFGTVTVDYEVLPGTATAGADYVPASGTLTFPSGITSQTLDVIVKGDLEDESDETIRLRLSSPVNAALVRDEAIGTIVDNDPPRISIDDVSVSGSLAATQAVFTVSLSNPSTETITVLYTTANGTATAGTDYIQTTNVLTFRPGERDQNIAIPVLGNTQDEGNEVFFVRLFNPFRATPGKMQGIAEILNEEKPIEPPSVAIVSPADGAIYSFGRPVPVAVNARDPDGQLVDVQVSDNGITLAHWPAGPYALTLSNASAGLHLFQARATDDQGLSSTSTVVRISVEPLPTLSLADVAVVEGNNGARPVAVNLRLSHAARLPVAVEYDYAGVTARAGDDFTGAPGVAILAPGETNITIAPSILGDRSYEGDEVFRVILTQVTGAVAPISEATVTILDDDLPPVLTIEDSSVVEGDSGARDMVFTVTLSGETTLPASVAFGTEDGSASAGVDYLARVGTLSFGSAVQALSAGPPALQISLANSAVLLGWPSAGGILSLEESNSLKRGSWRPAGAQATLSGDRWAARIAVVEGYRFYRLTPAGASGRSQEIRIPVLGDTLIEPAEHFVVRLTQPVNARLATDHAQGVIIDDDQPSLAVSDLRVTEGDAGVIPAQFSVKLSAPSVRTVTVSFATADGTAAALVDFLPVDQTLTFLAGETEKIVPVSIIGDLVNEPEEFFTVVLSGPQNAVLARPVGTCVIADNDATPELSVSSASVPEGNSGSTLANVTLALSRPSSQPVAVTFRTENGTAIAPADYESATGSVTFSPGEVSRSIGVRIQGDLLSEGDETFVVRAAVGSAIGENSPTGLVTILDDDAPPALSISDVAVQEGDSGATLAKFTVSLKGLTSRAVSVTAATQDGTALAGVDYVAATAVLTFGPGENSKTFEVPVLGDFADELDEFFSVVLSGPTGATLARGSARGRVLDDDDPPPVVNVTGNSVTEGDSGFSEVEVRVTLTGASKQVTRVSYRTAPGSAGVNDYQTATGTITFAPGELTKTVKLLVAGDLTPEPDETFHLELTDPVNATLGQSSAEILIRDDDSPVARVADVEVLEGTGGTTDAAVTFELSTASFRQTSVNYMSVPGSATEADFQPATGVITFAAGETRKTLTLKIIADSVAEETEEFFLKLSNPVNLLLGSPQATVRIRDDDGLREPPVIAITYPADQDVFPLGAEIVINASAQQGTAPVDKVEIFADGQLLTAATFAPLVSFNWLNAGEGAHTLTAVATENNGAKTESSVVHITIQPNDNRQRVAIVQNFADPEISKLQNWLAEMDLSSRVFNQDGLTYEMLAAYDLILWDDLGTAIDGLTANDVAIFKQLHDQEKPLYFIGTRLVTSGNNLPVNLRPLWAELSGLRSGTASTTTRFVPNADRHPVTSGAFGLVGEFHLDAFENVSATLLGNNSVAHTETTGLVVVSDDFARIVSQNLLPTRGTGLNAAIQREKLFKNSVAWLLRLTFPPFLNLSLEATLTPAQPAVGSTFQASFKVQHSGELEAKDIVLTVSLPTGIAYLTSDLPNDKCILDDGAVLCFLGNLAHTESAALTLTLEQNAQPLAPLLANVSASNAEAVVEDNTVDLNF